MSILDIDLAVRIIKNLRDHTAYHGQCLTWDAPGIRAMLTTADGPPGACLAAALLAAEDAKCEKPSTAAIRTHWPTQAGEPPAPIRRTVVCPEHDTDEHECRDQHRPSSPAVAAKFAAEARAAARAGVKAREDRQREIAKRREEANR